jgi:hypothetical protein
VEAAMIKKFVIFAFLGFALLISITGCGGGNKDEITVTETPDDFPDIDQFEFRSKNFLPTEIGTEWTYAIEIGETDPLKYSEVVWPTGDSAMLYSNISLFPVLFASEEKPEKFLLTIRVKGSPPKQGPFEYNNAAELEVVKDDLGVYEGAKQIFWLISPGRFQLRVVEAITYDPSLAPGEFAREDGYSQKLLLLDCLPGLSYEERMGWDMENMSAETLTSLLHTTDFPQYEGTLVLHYQRIVESDEKREATGYLNNGFTEDTWFAEGKGLIRLEQKVDGKVSMIWTLDQFSDGTEQ